MIDVRLYLMFVALLVCFIWLANRMRIMEMTIDLMKRKEEI